MHQFLIREAFTVQISLFGLMLLSICVDQCQEDDDGQQSSQNRGAIRIKISIFLIVLDGFRSDVVPKRRNHASPAKNSQ